ncbi:hypothetical protein U9M48_036658 [Paspalum notatum var. saurae]|uniref:Uncharacterized protein n=1 Tax=Paspalum notatum var. saurae TaxID=547442 RepID=A0AAQ3UEW1_PASNO
MGQCSFSRQPEAEQVGQEPPAAAVAVDGRKRQEQEQRRKKAAAAAAHMNQPYQASSHDELVLMVSLDSITKIM